MGLEVKNLTYSYIRDKVVLNDVSLSINEGRTVGIIGRNGVGKTTLMKCIIKLLRVDNNKIFLDGVDINTIPPKERAKLISYVPQSISMPDSSVFDSILIGRLPYMRGTASKEDLKVVEDTIRLLSLDSLAFLNVNSLSGGQRQKVAIARAIASNPRLLYLDEPTSNLDLKNQIEVIRTINKIAHEQNRIAILNIQDVNLALRYLDDVIILNDSKVLYSGVSTGLSKEILYEALNVDVDILNLDNKKIIYINEEM